MTIYNFGTVFFLLWTIKLLLHDPFLLFIGYQTFSISKWGDLVYQYLTYEQKKPHFWNSLVFSIIRHLLATWSLVSLPLLNLVYRYVGFHSMCGWNLDCKILRIILLACEIISVTWTYIFILWYVTLWKITCIEFIPMNSISAVYNTVTVCLGFNRYNLIVWQQLHNLQ